jgi:uncharacterized protein
LTRRLWVADDLASPVETDPLLPTGPRACLAWLALAGLCAAACGSGALPGSQRSGLVTDRAGILPPARASALERRLSLAGESLSAEVCVYVDRRLPPGADLDRLGPSTLRDWEIGRRFESRGALFLVFTEDRRLRIDFADGFGDAVGRAAARRIVDGTVKPRLQSGDLAGGVEAGAEAILQAIREAAPARRAQVGVPAGPWRPGPWTTFFLSALVGLIAGGALGRMKGGGVGLVAAFLVTLVVMFAAGVWLADVAILKGSGYVLLSGIVLPFLFNAAQNATADHTSIKAYRPHGAYDRSSHGPGTDGPDGGDDGGGGDSGGSGASGSW